MRTVWDDTVKRCPKPCFTVSFICENWFDPFDSVPLVTLHFKIFVIRKGWLCKISCTISNAMFGDFYEILQSHPFLRSKILKRRFANSTESNKLILFSRKKEIVEQGLGHLFTLLPQIVLISSIKPTSTGVEINFFNNLPSGKWYQMFICPRTFQLAPPKNRHNKFWSCLPSEKTL